MERSCRGDTIKRRSCLFTVNRRRAVCSRLELIDLALKDFVFFILDLFDYDRVRPSLSLPWHTERRPSAFGRGMSPAAATGAPTRSSASM